MKEYYAHSENAHGKKETLKEHLLKTAELAKSYAGCFGEDIVGEWLGIFHDAGKATDLFQDVLKGEATNVNHAAVGACILNRYEQISRTIYAHHDGLQWFIKDDLNRLYLGEKPFDTQSGKRFSASGKQQIAEVTDYIRKNVDIPDEQPVLKSDINSEYTNLPQMLHSRMLLSCLCDADYTATASHYDGEVLQQAEEMPLDAEHILKKLEDYRENIIKHSSADNKMIQLRNKVYQSCLKAASHEPGMFTLTAPTGTGKTLALMAFALKHALLHEKRRIIIVLPFLSVISQNAKIYREFCNDVLESHSMALYGDDEKQRLLSEKWNSPVVITTSVKFFEAFFKSKPSDLRFLHSISDSVVVFDEAQCIPHELIGTTLDTMRALCETYKSTVLFSTATQPPFEIRHTCFSATEIIEDAENLYKSANRVEINWQIEQNTSLEDIAVEMAEHNSVCCVLNRKDHTHRLFELLSEKCNIEECFHISTDMCKKHRDDVIQTVTQRMKNGLPCRLVSTSCIEAGVDLDFEIMYRALAPLESIVQCAGRCNRNGTNKGAMTVFIPDEDKLYPVKYIKNAAEKVKLLKSRHSIDICNPAHINEYYRLIFEDSNYNHDKPSLVSAINEHNFEETEKQYRFIPSAGVNVLVPYKGEYDLYESLVNEARENGISKSWIRRAAPLTVTSYRENKLRDIAECCYTRTAKKPKYEKKQVSGWYILLDSKFYDDNSGLLFDDDSSLDYLV